jgi:glycine reductase complex component B subunit gamma
VSGASRTLVSIDSEEDSIDMEPIRVVHYLNQFFAGVGGEKRADVEPAVRRGPIGPGLPLQAALAGAGEVVATVYCGDDHFNVRGEAAIERIVALIGAEKPAVVVAGPAFASGRYGMACAAVAQAVEARLHVPAVTAMSPENPAVEVYRHAVTIVPTGDSPAATAEIVGRMARLAVKRGRGEALGSSADEGYLPRGVRRNVLDPRIGAVRVVDLVLAKLRGAPYRTEVPLPDVDPLVPAPPLVDPSTATIALVTSGGVVPRGNPDHIEARRASRWSKFSIAGLDDLTSDDFECVHGGFDNELVGDDPDRVLPVDVMRDLARDGAIGRLHETCYVTVGAGGPIERARRFGRDIAEELLAAGVQAVIMTAT